MNISNHIAQLILDMIEQDGGSAEMKRNDLAQMIGCVPSQINYVISSRFTPELGYIVESRRGGGGYVRIIRKQLGRDEYLMHFFCAIGDEIDENGANAFLGNLLGSRLITEREAKLMKRVLSSTAMTGVAAEDRPALRASQMKQMVLSLME